TAVLSTWLVCYKRLSANTAEQRPPRLNAQKHHGALANEDFGFEGKSFGSAGLLKPSCKLLKPVPHVTQASYHRNELHNVFRWEAVAAEFLNRLLKGFPSRDRLR